MHYIFNKVIKFYPGVNELSLVNDAQSSIVISNSSARLLLLLTQHSGRIVSRDDLLKNVWEDYGYTASNNNLYMAISEVRKAFSSLSDEGNLIITVPKVGLKLEAEIDIIENDDHVAVRKISFINKKSASCSVEINATNIKIFISLMMVILSSGFFVVKMIASLPLNESKDTYVFRYKECAVYSHSLSSGMVSVNDNFRERIIQKLKQYNEFCDDKRDVYFHIAYRMQGVESGYFTGICRDLRSSGSRACRTITEELD